MKSSVVHAAIPGELEVVRVLLREYAGTLGFNLCFQNFEEELAQLPGKYAEPGGCLLLAKVDGEAVGCVALRPLGERICEMKRLYVRPAGRGLGVGRDLAQCVISEARARGYTAMRLDTIPATMAGAVRLYQTLGFVSIPAYSANPIVGAEYMELRLGEYGGQVKSGNAARG